MEEEAKQESSSGMSNMSIPDVAEVLEGAEKALDGVSRRLKTEFNSVMDNLEESAGFVDEEVESVFEPVEGLYVAPITLEEYKTTKLKGREYKSSWDELFFDLALVATFGSLAQILALFEPLHDSSHSASHHDDHGDDGGHDDHSEEDHHRLLSSSAQVTHMSFPQSIAMYCLCCATVISVRRFTDGHRSQWFRNDLVGSMLLLLRAGCVVGMGAVAKYGNEKIWQFHAFFASSNVVAGAAPRFNGPSTCMVSNDPPRGTHPRFEISSRDGPSSKKEPNRVDAGRETRLARLADVSP